jgi:Prolyl oligopeptidase family
VRHAGPTNGPTTRDGCCTHRASAATRTGTCIASTLENLDAAAVDLTPFPGAKAYFELPGGRPGKAIVGLNKRDVALSDANFMRTLPPAARPHLANIWRLFVGNPDDPEQEADMLARSPITRVDEIRTPLLVIQGANDPRAVQAESDNLVEALRARGVEVAVIVEGRRGAWVPQPRERDRDVSRGRALLRPAPGRSAAPALNFYR